MREIKFRAWDKFNKSWIYSDHQRGLAWFFDCLEKCENSERFTESAVSPLGFELMQFTGLLDKNGKEIYESDIVRNSNHFKYGTKNNPPGFAPNYVVSFLSYGYWAFVGKEHRYFSYREYPAEFANNGNWEIIGNIYENSELLKDSK